MESSGEQLRAAGFVESFLPLLPTLLGDKDLKVQAHQVVVKLCSFAPTAIVSFSDQLIDPIEKTLTKKTTKEGMQGPEVERAMEVIKSGVRVVLAINRLDEQGEAAGLTRRWLEFFDRISKREPTAEIVLQLRDEKSDI